jgi:hypothetical protein
VVLAIRGFNSKELFPNKPSSKLINAWRANTVCICGVETAFMAERKEEYDFVEVANFEDLKKKLVVLKNDQNLLLKYKRRSIENSRIYSNSFFVKEWIKVIDEKVLPQANVWSKKGILVYLFFILKRFSFLKFQSTKLRVDKLVSKFMRPVYE